MQIFSIAIQHTDGCLNPIELIPETKKQREIKDFQMIVYSWNLICKSVSSFSLSVAGKMFKRLDIPIRLLRLCKYATLW